MKFTFHVCDITSERNVHGLGTDITRERNVQGTDITSERKVQDRHRNIQRLDITSERNVQTEEIYRVWTLHVKGMHRMKKHSGTLHVRK